MVIFRCDMLVLLAPMAVQMLVAGEVWCVEMCCGFTNAIASTTAITATVAHTRINICML